MQGEIHDLIDAQIGRKVRERRLLLGLSQRDLASSLGISAQQMAKYENGTSSLSAGRLYQVATRLNVPMASLFAGVGSDPHETAADPSTSEGEVSHGLFELVRTYSSLPDADVQSAVRDLLRALAGRERAPENDDIADG